MSHFSAINFAECTPVNDLWPRLIAKLGMEKAKYAVAQALDLQRMHGFNGTVPVLLAETCGLALVKVNSLRSQMGLPCHGEGMVLILSTKEKVVQLLQEA